MKIKIKIKPGLIIYIYACILFAALIGLVIGGLAKSTLVGVLIGCVIFVIALIMGPAMDTRGSD